MYDPLCGYNWEIEHRSKICYMFNPHPSSWSAARSQCQSMGGDLLSINSLGEHYYISGSLFRSSDFPWSYHLVLIRSVLFSKYCRFDCSTWAWAILFFNRFLFSKLLRIFVCVQIVRKRSHSYGALPQIFDSILKLILRTQRLTELRVYLLYMHLKLSQSRNS